MFCKQTLAQIVNKFLKLPKCLCVVLSSPYIFVVGQSYIVNLMTNKSNT